MVAGEEVHHVIFLESGGVGHGWRAGSLCENGVGEIFGVCCGSEMAALSCSLRLENVRFQSSGA